MRECFEESGILLARGEGGKGGLVEIGEGEREEGRRGVHGGEVRFGEWVAGRQGAVPDLGMFPIFLLLASCSPLFPALLLAHP